MQDDLVLQVFVDANIDMCMGRLANLNIRTQPTNTTQGAVELKGALKATIEDCNIEGSLILSDSRETLVRNNFIHSGQQNGVLVEGGDGSIINNDVTGHKMCGLVLKGNAYPMVSVLCQAVVGVAECLVNDMCRCQAVAGVAGVAECLVYMCKPECCGR